MIGDVDPEDAYDAGDPFPVRLEVIARIVAALPLEADLGRRMRRRAEVVRLLRRVTEDVAADG